MYPIVAHLGERGLTSWAASRLLAAVIAAFLFVRLRGNTISFADMLRLCGVLYISAFFFGMVGSMISRNDFSGFKGLNFFTEAAVASQGSIVGCSLSAYMFTKIKKISFYSISDTAAPIAALVYAIARFGCYLQGCCQGTEAHYFWGVVFPGEEVFRHPVQLYDSFLNFALFLFLLEVREQKRYEGQLFFLFLLGNSVIRFFVEYFRWGVSAQVMWGVITQAQMASLGIIVASLYFMRKLSVKQKTHAEFIVQA